MFQWDAHGAVVTSIPMLLPNYQLAHFRLFEHQIKSPHLRLPAIPFAKMHLHARPGVTRSQVSVVQALQPM